jgi:hypothetical protein
MKTRIPIIFLLFILNAAYLFAGSDTESPGVKSSFLSEILLRFAAPVIPREATFDDDPSGMQSISPDRSFPETKPVQLVSEELLKIARPEIPQEAAFTDTDPGVNDLKILAPAIPHEASFEENK